MHREKEQTNGAAGQQTRRTGRRGVLGLLGAAAFMATPFGVILPALLGVTRATEAAKSAADRVRRWMMIIDLRSCDGCQSVAKPPQCTEGCIQGHYLAQPMEWIQVYEADLHGTGTQFVPTPCQHCQNPPCTNVCPVGATFSTPEGLVLIDQERCIGCRICMAACPYDRRFFNWAKPAQPAELPEMDYLGPERQAPSFRGTVMKCDFCPDLARAGRLPHCAQSCPNHAIYFGDLEEDLATNGRDVVRVSKFLAENAAYRIREDLGTQPRTYYIPGYGQAVGRSPNQSGRKATVWPWQQTKQGSKTWTR
jgi:Fe-S-cluster-containing dehydrogenase component